MQKDSFESLKEQKIKDEEIKEKPINKEIKEKLDYKRGKFLLESYLSKEDLIKNEIKK